jgi:hypothetical protein
MISARTPSPPEIGLTDLLTNDRFVTLQNSTLKTGFSEMPARVSCVLDLHFLYAARLASVGLMKKKVYAATYQDLEIVPASRMLTLTFDPVCTV